MTDIIDALLIAQYSVNLFNSLPIGGCTLTPFPTMEATPDTGFQFSTEISALKDTYTAGLYSLDNFGSVETFRIGKYAQGSSVQSLLSFYIGSVPGTIVSATLSLNKQDGDNRVIHLYGCNDSSWSEMIVTWNTRPAIGIDILSQQTVNGTNTFDVTSYVQSQQVYADFYLTCDGTDTELQFSSKEATSNRPSLKIDYIIDSTPTPTPTMPFEEDSRVLHIDTSDSLAFETPTNAGEISVYRTGWNSLGLWSK